MKVLFIGVFDEKSTNVSQAKALERNGCDIIRYPYREREKALGTEARDMEIIEQCRANECDLVLMSKCNEVGAAVVPGCQLAGAKVALWYMDPLWNFTPEIENRVRACDMTFCALTKPYEEAKKIAGDKVYFLQEGFDAEVDKPWGLPQEYDVSFIGNLAHSGKRKDYARKVPFKVITGVFGEDHAKAVSQSKRINRRKTGTNKSLK